MSTVRAALDLASRSPGRAFLVVFVVAFAVRAAMLGFVPPQDVWPETLTELGRAAHTLATTGQYADPYAVPTGPTAHPLPIYTGLLALLYRVFGFTLTAGYVRCLLHIAASSAVFALLPWIALRLGAGAPAGLLAGLTGAVFPYQGIAEVLGWWGDDRYAALALGGLLVVSLHRWTTGRTSALGALALGLGWGAAFHLSPALLPVMLGCLAFELWWVQEHRRLLSPAVMAVGAALACVPWAWRNHAVFHELVFIRSNFGLELRLGNHEGTAATWDALAARKGPALRHPGGNRAEASRVQGLGEMAYMREARGEAVSWIRTHPVAFLRLTARRALHWWLGPLDGAPAAIGLCVLTAFALLGAWRLVPALTTPQRAALLIPLALFPVVYYLVPYSARYRVPIDWILLIFAGEQLRHWAGWRGLTADG